jgi:hypothetical protein
MGAVNPLRDKGIDWESLQSQLDERGFAVMPGALTAKSCEEIAALYSHDELFRNRIEMSHYSFGQGEYKYFKYPLPPLIQEIREFLYPHLVPLANEWLHRLGNDNPRFPEKLSDFLDQCHGEGQGRPTPLILKYGPGDYNRLHQDLYGEIVFPFQVTFFLSQREKDFQGGEFVLTEQRPRQQSRVEVLLPNQGEGVIFAVHHRPVPGARGYYRATLRHGVSTIHSGERYTLGVIFHDAK